MHFDTPSKRCRGDSCDAYDAPRVPVCRNDTTAPPPAKHKKSGPNACMLQKHYGPPCVLLFHSDSNGD